MKISKLVLRRNLLQLWEFSIVLVFSRFSIPPADLWEWYEPFLEDEEVGISTQINFSDLSHAVPKALKQQEVGGRVCHLHFINLISLFCKCKIIHLANKILQNSLCSWLIFTISFVCVLLQCKILIFCKLLYFCIKNNW